jgi:short-subunit dehydrogenase
VNYQGTFNAARAALPIFRRQRHGHVVIISSIVGKRGVPYVGAYAATKFAQVGLAESLRAELVGSGIYVTIVYPISTDSEFYEVMVRHSGYATRARGPRQSTERVADAVARAIEHPVPEVYPYRLSKGLAVINSIAPGLCDRIVKRWGRKPIA